MANVDDIYGQLGITKPDFSKLAQQRAEREKMAGRTGNWFIPPSGTSTIRLLPPKGYCLPIFATSMHYGALVTDQGWSVWIPCRMAPPFNDNSCPVCELIDELSRRPDVDRDFLNSISASFRAFANIVVREGGESGGDLLQSFRFGSMIYDGISSIQVNVTQYGDITDIATGRDLLLTKTGSGLGTKYQVIPAGSSSPLHQDPQVVVAWLEQMPPLVELVGDADSDTYGRAIECVRNRVGVARTSVAMSGFPQQQPQQQIQQQPQQQIQQQQQPQQQIQQQPQQQIQQQPQPQQQQPQPQQQQLQQQIQQQQQQPQQQIQQQQQQPQQHNLDELKARIKEQIAKRRDLNGTASSTG